MTVEQSFEPSLELKRDVASWCCLMKVHSSNRTVAVVGVGASGALVALHLLRAARARNVALRLVLIDRNGTFGPGIAYATTDPQHLLNTPSSRLAAYDDDPSHFSRWAAVRGFGHDPHAFLPRQVYGQYLSQLLRIEASGVPTEWLIDEAVAVQSDTDGHRLELRSGRQLDIDSLILAPGAGVASVSSLIGITDVARYVDAPWRDSELFRISDDRPVLVVGTGLTMVDVVLSLGRRSPRTVVHAISRHGLLPRSHRPSEKTRSSPGPIPTACTLAELVRAVRGRIEDEPDRWREVVDELRPHVPQLWRRLELHDRQRFMNRLHRFWDVHRHRVAPAVDARLTDLRRRGCVHIHAGQVLYARANADGYEVLVDTRAGQRLLDVGWIVNATGFAGRIENSPDLLLQGMLDQGLVVPDLLKVGIDTTEQGRVFAGGLPSTWIFAVGALRRGTLYESTAIPEIRAQAASVASLAIPLPGLDLPLG